MLQVFLFWLLFFQIDGWLSNLLDYKSSSGFIRKSKRIFREIERQTNTKGLAFHMNLSSNVFVSRRRGSSFSRRALYLSSTRALLVPLGSSYLDYFDSGQSGGSLKVLNNGILPQSQLSGIT